MEKNNPNYIDGRGKERDVAKSDGRPVPELFLGNKYNGKIKMDGHHFNEKIIIYIPTSLHQKYRHNLRTGKGMKEINTLAFKFLIGKL